MKNEAKANEETDKQAKEKIEKVNQADSLIFQTEKQLKEYGEKIPAEKKQPIEAALTKLKEAHKQQDIPAIDTAVAEMNTAWTAASEDMYKATQDTGAQQGSANGNGQQEGATGEPQSQGATDNVTDAEFEEVK